MEMVKTTGTEVITEPALLVAVPDPTMVVAKGADGSWHATLVGYITPRDIAMGQRALLLAFRNRVFQMRLDAVTAEVATAEAAAQEKKND